LAPTGAAGLICLAWQEAGVPRSDGQRVRVIPEPEKGVTLTIVDEARAVTGGVDTHAGSHMAAALDRIGGLLGVQEFPATPDGYARLLAWLRMFGTVSLAGIEGTGSYGAGLARHITGAGIRVAGVDRSDRQDRRRADKTRPPRCGQRRPGGPVRAGIGGAQRT
jgi:hypothetical protein